MTKNDLCTWKIFRRSVRPKWCGQFFRRAVSQPFSRHPSPSQLPSHYHPKNHPKPKTKIHKIWIKRKPKIKCPKWKFLLQNWKKHVVHYWPGLDSFLTIFEEISEGMRSSSWGSNIFKNPKWTQKKIRRSHHMGLISLYSWWKTSCIGWFFYTRWWSTNQWWELLSTKWTLLFVELLLGLWNAWWRKL